LLRYIHIHDPKIFFIFKFLKFVLGLYFHVVPKDESLCNYINLNVIK